MKLIYAFLLIGAFAILETAAVPIRICPRSLRLNVGQKYSLPRKSIYDQKAVTNPDNVQFGLLSNGGKEVKPWQEKVGTGNPGAPARPGRSSPSQPTRVFSEMESSQPEYVDMDDTRFQYGNYQR